MDLEGKIIISIKEGPGLLLGINELDIKGGFVEFDDLSFDTPGKYVLTLSSTNNLIESKDITINVLNVEETSTKNSDVKPDELPRPIITQIDPPTVKLDPMEITASSDKTDTNLVAGSIGVTPFIRYNGSIIINDRDISILKLYHEGIVPKISFLFKDSIGLIKSKGFPKDDTKFEFFLNSRSPNLKSIHLKFKVEDFKDMGEGEYKILGALDISDLYLIKFKAYNGTSFEVLRDICKELSLGYNSNIQKTNDSMVWRNVGDRQHKFMDKIIHHSYISDDSYMTGYIDYYYCFNYIDVEKEANRDISNDKGIDTGSLGNEQTTDFDRLVPISLSDDNSLNSSSFYFKEERFINNSTKVSLTEGYKKRTKTYDSITKQFLVFDVDSTTSQGDKTFILKGDTNDNELYDKNLTTTYAGKIDVDNVHKDYNYAKTQNKINLDNLKKLIVDIVLPNPNFNLYKYQKVNLNFVNHVPTVSMPDPFHWNKTGEWIISNIEYLWESNKLVQKIKLYRKEIGKTHEEVKNTPPTQTDKQIIDTSNRGITQSIIPNGTQSINENLLVVSENIPNQDILLPDEDLTNTPSEFTENVYEGEEEMPFIPQSDEVQMSLLEIADSERDLSDSNYSETGEYIKGHLNTTADSGPGFGIIGKNMSDDKILQIMVQYIEGGYYYPGHSSNFDSNSKNLYKTSGETLWGLDRVNMAKSSYGYDFWNTVDELSGYGNKTGGKTGYSSKTKTGQWDFSKYPAGGNTWKYNFSPKKSTKGYDLMLNSFTKYANDNLSKWLDTYFGSHPLKTIILSDARFKFMWFRAVWNGPGHFKNYAEKLKKSYNISTNIEDLIIMDLNNRLSRNITLITHDVKKIAKLIGIRST